MSAQSLALQVALRLDRDPATCAAWLDSADRVCGRGASQPWLCKRHVTVAEKREAKQREKDEARADAARAARETLRPEREARLAAIDQRLRAIDPLYGDPAGGDTAAINAPLRQRLPSDTRIAELARLHREREWLVAALAPNPEKENDR